MAEPLSIHTLFTLQGHLSALLAHIGVSLGHYEQTGPSDLLACADRHLQSCPSPTEPREKRMNLNILLIKFYSDNSNYLNEDGNF